MAEMLIPSWAKRWMVAKRSCIMVRVRSREASRSKRHRVTGAAPNAGSGTCCTQVRVPLEDAQHDIAQVPQEVETISDLQGLGRTQACPVGIFAAAIPADDMDAGMGAQPRGQAASAPVGEEVDNPVPFEVDQDAAVGAPAAKGEVVHTEHARRGLRGREIRANACE